MPASTPTLRDMVQDALDRGQTLEQLESVAVDPETGQRASRALLSRLRRGEVDRMPYDYHLRAVAAALKQPYENVRQAAIRQWLPAPAAEGESIEDKVERLTKMTAQLLDEVGSQREAGGERGSA